MTTPDVLDDKVDDNGRRCAALWCPAYPLADAPAAAAALVSATVGLAPLGWDVAVSPHFGRHPGPGAWLSLEERQQDLVWAMQHDLLVAARGGYGCIELAESFHDALVLRQRVDRPLPVLVGYSDVTIFHAILARHGGWGVYGWMPGVKHGDRAMITAKALLSSRPGGAPVGSMEVIRPGHATGRLVPACLRVLTSLVGSPWMPELQGCILALEDTNERPYQTERDLWQLHHAGVLTHLAGLVFGAFPHERPQNSQEPTHQQVARRWADRLQIPTAFGLPFGHDPDPIALPVGWTARLRVTDRTVGLHWNR
jgi:muramoyltetrapeptide carboxypeptidase